MAALLAFLKGLKLTGPMVGIAVAAAVLIGVYMKGRLDEGELCAERLNIERAAQYKKAMEEQQKAVAAATEWGKKVGKQRVVIKTVFKEVEKLIESNPANPVCFTDDGVRLVNSAIGAGSDPAGRDNGTVPAPATSRRWAGEHDLDSLGGHYRQIPFLQGEARSSFIGNQFSTDSSDVGTEPRNRFHSSEAVENSGRR